MALMNFSTLAYACDWGDFAVFDEEVRCHATVRVRSEFDVAFVFEGADGFGDGRDGGYGVEV